MNPPIVYLVTSPSAHNSSKTTETVHNKFIQPGHEITIFAGKSSEGSPQKGQSQ